MASRRPKRHSNPSKYSLRARKGRRRFVQNKKRNTLELLKGMG